MDGVVVCVCVSCVSWGVWGGKEKPILHAAFETPGGGSVDDEWAAAGGLEGTQ